MSGGMWGASESHRALVPLRVGAGLSTHGHGPSPGLQCHRSERVPGTAWGVHGVVAPQDAASSQPALAPGADGCIYGLGG